MALLALTLLNIFALIAYLLGREGKQAKCQVGQVQAEPLSQETLLPIKMRGVTFHFIRTEKIFMETKRKPKFIFR